MFSNILASTALQLTTSRIGSSWAWYFIRGAGFAALFLMFLLMISGIGHVTGLTYRFIEPIKAWAIHKAIAFGLVFAVLVHVIFLLFDHYVSFSFPQIVIPFLNRYTNGTSLFGINVGMFIIADGIIAMYLIFLIVLTSLGWIDTKKKAWRWVHYSSYIAAIMVFVHALGAGSDLKYGTFRAFMIFLLVVLILATITRLARSGTLKNKD
jgi:DMSO/TMAO reductase YedYZ heme-binding membrane subunit